MQRWKKWTFEDIPGAQPVGMAAVRITLGLLWLSNLGWKLPPNFGQNNKSGLYRYVSDAVEHPVLPPFSWVMQHVVLPNFQIFGWLTLLVETLLAVLLLTGTLTRPAALLGIGQSLAIGLSVAAAPGEWPWSYLLMIAAHAAVFFASPARMPGVDRVLLSDRAQRSERARRVLVGWGVVTVAVGLWSTLGSLGKPVTGPGISPGVGVLQLYAGQFNVLGGVLLILLGAGMALAGRRQEPGIAMAVAAVAAVAAFSVVVRWGFGNVLLGGSGGSTAVLLSVAALAGLLGRVLAAGQVRAVTRGTGPTDASTKTPPAAPRNRQASSLHE